jgi:hypothetical protein
MRQGLNSGGFNSGFGQDRGGYDGRKSNNQQSEGASSYKDEDDALSHYMD